MLILFLKGLLIGFVVAAPVGPIGILCIQRTLHDGFKIGLISGLGAAFADCIYGTIAAFSYAALYSFLIQHQFWLGIGSGLFLMGIGLRLFFTTPKDKSAANTNPSAWQAFGTTFFLTFTNPATVLLYVAVFAIVGLKQMSFDYSHAIILSIGISLGSCAWWLLLSSGVAFLLHHRLTPTMMKSINRLSGVILFSFGLAALAVF